MTEFFPTDVLINSDLRNGFLDEVASDAAGRLSRENRLEFLKGYLRNEKLAELVVSLDEAVDHLDVEFNQDKIFFMKQAHMADLVWLAQELKGTVAGWGDDETHNAISKQRIKTLLSALDKRIVEVS